MRLKDKVAIITGSGSGFGEGIARRFAEEGACVVVNDINASNGERVANEIVAAGGKAIFIAADVTARADVAAMVRQTVARFGGLDIMVNNAGVTHRNKSLMEVTDDEFDRIYAVNVKALYLAAQEVVPEFIRRGGGVFLNTSSTAALRPRPGLVFYNGSKGAANTITKGMAAELAPHKIRVNAICPVLGATGLTSDFIGGDSAELIAKFVATVPLGRMSTPLDIANAALFLCSDEAQFLTGVCMEVDGGRCI